MDMTKRKDAYTEKLLRAEWDKVTKPIQKRLDQLGIDIPLVCSDGRKGDEEEDE